MGIKLAPTLITQTSKVAPNSRPALAVKRFHDCARQRPTCTCAGRARISAVKASVLTGKTPAVTGGVGAVGRASASANSGKADAGFHSGLPSAWICVCALILPSAIQRRSSSALTGPYSFLSPPMILYIYLYDCRRRDDESLIPLISLCSGFDQRLVTSSPTGIANAVH